MELVYSVLYMLGEMAPYILLGFLLAGVMHAFIPQRAFARHLSGSGWRAVVKAAMIGVPLPLCSCGVLPTAIAMRRGGASNAASTSFLISTPQTGADSIAATWSLLGPAFALIRPVAALVTAVLGGVCVGRWAESDERGVDVSDSVCAVSDAPRKGFMQKCKEALRYGFVDLVESIGGWLVTGLVVAALITVYVPDSFFVIIGGNPVLSMIAVLVVAVPMYVCATGSIPIAMALMMKGLSPGTALVLLMAGPAANFASFALISREMGRKAASVYLGVIAAGAMVFGLAIDYLLPSRWFLSQYVGADCCGGVSMSPVAYVGSAVLIVLLIVASVRKYRSNKKTILNTDMSKEYVIKGMNCPHCRAAVAKSIASVPGVTDVDVNLATGLAVVDGVHNADAVVDAVRAAGFDVELCN